MKPFRLRLTHQLLRSYGLTRHMDCYRPHPAQLGEMAYFHQEEYLNFLQKIGQTDVTINKTLSSLTTQKCRKYNVGPNQDCPAFEGLYEFNQLLTGASLDAAVQLATQQTDIAINWAGGFHHAKKAEASGFCYVNGTFSFLLLFSRWGSRICSLCLCLFCPITCCRSFLN